MEYYIEKIGNKVEERRRIGAVKEKNGGQQCYLMTLT